MTIFSLWAPLCLTNPDTDDSSSSSSLCSALLFRSILLLLPPKLSPFSSNFQSLRLQTHFWFLLWPSQKLPHLIFSPCLVLGDVRSAPFELLHGVSFDYSFARYDVLSWIFFIVVCIWRCVALKFCLLTTILSCFVVCRCCVDVIEIEFWLFRVVFLALGSWKVWIFTSWSPDYGSQVSCYCTHFVCQCFDIGMFFFFAVCACSLPIFRSDVVELIHVIFLKESSLL